MYSYFMTFSPQESDETTASNAETTRETKKINPILEIVQFAAIALIIVIPIRMFIAQPFIVSGASMEETFHTGEYLIVDQVSYRFNEVTRGDVIIFRYPRDPSKFFIKRVIGLPGDKITIEGNVVKVTNEQFPDGLTLDESYVKSMEPTTNLEETLGEREYFVMGDNRDQSSDSRVWGVLQEENIVGRALVRLFPVTEVGLLPGEMRFTNTGEAVREVTSE